MKFLVLGDAMEDVYFRGNIGRLNPEDHRAPLVSDCETFTLPGGAANVARGLEAIGCRVCLRSGHGKIKKNRVITEDGVVCRFDQGESLQPIKPSEISFDGYDGVVVSDYGKGSIDGDVIVRLAEAKMPVFIDTKKNPCEWVDVFESNEAVWFFPNDREFTEFYEEAMVLGFGLNVVHKMGRHGARMLRGGEVRKICPAATSLALNTTGAGDTVLASFVAGYTAINVVNQRWTEKLGSDLMEVEEVLLMCMGFAAAAVQCSTTVAPTFDVVRESIGYSITNVESIVESYIKGESWE